MYFRHVSFRPMIGRPLVIVKVLGELGDILPDQVLRDW